jgi:chromosome segregation ATPase
MTTVGLSYEELASRLGITVHSVRRMVNRHRWHKTLGNSGRTIVHVPEEYLAQREAERSTSRVALEATSEAAALRTAIEPAPEAGPGAAHLADLVARLGALQTELAEMARRAGAAEARVGELDRELTEALTIITDLRGKAFERDRLVGQLEGLRDVLNEVKGDRDRWATHAEQAQRRLADICARGEPAGHRPGWFARLFRRAD